MQWSDRIGRQLKLRDLHILLAVVERGSMAKAAAALRISQPAVSKAVADMEASLGVRLLERTRIGIEPTAHGRALVGRGHAVFDELKQGVEELAFLSDPAVGELRIGASEAVAAGFLPALIEQFCSAYPRVRLHVAQALFATMHYRELRERRIDLLIGRIATPLPERDLSAEVLYDDAIVVVAGKSSRWARARRIKLADLMNEPWILPPADTLPGELAMDFFQARSLPLPCPQITTLSIHLFCRLASSGRFVTVLPSSILKFNGADLPLKCLPVDPVSDRRPVGIVTVKNRVLSPVGQLLISSARELATSLARERRYQPTRAGRATAHSCR
jgi:DNA-binding transcriptional LysR family regulator